MASFSGILSTVSKAVPLVSGDNTVSDTEDHKPLLAGSGSAGYVSEDESTRKKSKPSTNINRSVRKSSNDTYLHERTRVEDAVEGPQSASASSMGTSSSPGTTLPLSRTKSYRSFSNSQIETRSRAKGTVSPETRQRPIMVRLSDIKRLDALKRGKRQCRNDASNPATKDEGHKSTLEWRASMRSNSDPDLRLSSRASSRPDSTVPLKTCLKQKAKSANTTPPNEVTTLASNSIENQKLRRVKTVDFEKATSGSFPPQREAPGGSITGHRKTGGKRDSGSVHSCPGLGLLPRRSPAYPAVTRTDVHVIAIAPSSSNAPGLDLADQGNSEETDPATPTMQIVESGNGSYEVVWDDVPPEHSVRTQRRSSSANQALGAASAGTKGLERVNTKLTEWSGTWNTSSDSFKPTIVVFPDDDGRRPHFECAIVDDEDIEIFAPPNSERVSAVRSRRSSRPTSARTSRAASHDEFGGTTLPRVIPTNGLTTPPEAALVVSYSEAWSPYLVAARRKLGVLSPEQKLSNLEEADLRFRNHRDSVTLAHSRLINSSGVRPELFVHRDSVTMAKKRIHARNHQHTHRMGSESEPGQHSDGEAALIPPLPVVKAHAAEALKHGTPAPILHQTRFASGRHIRIEESL